MQYSHLFILHKSRKASISTKRLSYVRLVQKYYLQGCYIVTNEELILLFTDEEITYLGLVSIRCTIILAFIWSNSSSHIWISHFSQHLMYYSAIIDWWHYYVASYLITNKNRYLSDQRSQITNILIFYMQTLIRQ